MSESPDGGRVSSLDGTEREGCKGCTTKGEHLAAGIDDCLVEKLCFLGSHDLSVLSCSSS